MKLYHGTSEKAWQSILAGGVILPRADRKGNWGHTACPSHPQGVYLTDTYGGYFALMAVEGNENAFEKAVILEIDTEALVPNLVPDEDALEQLERAGKKQTRLAMNQRTAHFRSRLHTFKGSDAWRDSLHALGTCCHLGSIGVEHITRAATFDIKAAGTWSWEAIDATISVMNKSICGERHRKLMLQAFSSEWAEIINLKKGDY